MANKKEFTYTIEKECGIVSTAGSLPLELNVISYNGAPAKYDLRRWRTVDSQKKMQKGLVLTAEELRDLRDFLNAMEDI